MKTAVTYIIITSFCFLIARVYHRRGARRWRKVRRINGHAFVAKRLQVQLDRWMDRSIDG